MNGSSRALATPVPQPISEGSTATDGNAEAENSVPSVPPLSPSHAHGVSDDAREAHELWAGVLRSVRGKLSPRRREEIATATRCLERTPSVLRIAAQPRALRAWAQDGRLSLLHAALAERTEGGAELAIVPSADLSDTSADLSHFVVSSANESLYARIRELATRAPALGQRAFLLCGPPGSGKTHLVRGIGGTLRASRAAVRELSGDALSMALVGALREGNLERLRAPLCEADCVIVDEVESLGSREGSQRELALLIDRRNASGRSLVLAARGEPTEAPDIGPELRAALDECERWTLDGPEWETRVAIILERFAHWQVQASQRVVDMLATALGAGLSRLDAVLTRLLSHPSSAGSVRDEQLVRRVLEGRGPVGLVTHPQAVLHAVSEHFRVRPNDLRSRSKGPRVSTPRQVAMYLMRHHCGLSYPEIAARFKRHHTTAIHACRQIEKRRDADTKLRASVALLEKELLRLSEDEG